MLCEVGARSHYAPFTKLRSASVCTISNESHCKIGAKRVIRKLCFALNQHEMRNVAQYGFSMREPCGLSTNSNPSFVPHWPNVTHLLGTADNKRVEWNMYGNRSVFVLRAFANRRAGVDGRVRAYARVRAASSARSMTGCDLSFAFRV
jgi:hypothetical protein